MFTECLAQQPFDISIQQLISLFDEFFSSQLYVGCSHSLALILHLIVSSHLRFNFSHCLALCWRSVRCCQALIINSMWSYPLSCIRIALMAQDCSGGRWCEAQIIRVWGNEWTTTFTSWEIALSVIQKKKKGRKIQMQTDKTCKKESKTR